MHLCSCRVRPPPVDQWVVRFIFFWPSLQTTPKTLRQVSSLKHVLLETKNVGGFWRFSNSDLHQLGLVYFPKKFSFQNNANMTSGTNPRNISLTLRLWAHQKQIFVFVSTPFNQCLAMNGLLETNLGENGLKFCRRVFVQNTVGQKERWCWWFVYLMFLKTENRFIPRIP